MRYRFFEFTKTLIKLEASSAGIIYLFFKVNCMISYHLQLRSSLSVPAIGWDLISIIALFELIVCICGFVISEIQARIETQKVKRVNAQNV